MKNPTSKAATAIKSFLGITTQQVSTGIMFSGYTDSGVVVSQDPLEDPKNPSQTDKTPLINNENPPTMCTMEYAPVCAEVQVQCIKAPCPPIKQTFGNKCMMNANKLAKFLYNGECSDTKPATVDLSTCSSYFDGCNTCTVKDGKLAWCTKKYCQTNETPKCLVPTVGIANPASVNCVKLGGKLTIKEGTGGQYGECALPSGKICEERALYRGECKN